MEDASYIDVKSFAFIPLTAFLLKTIKIGVPQFVLMLPVRSASDMRLAAGRIACGTDPEIVFPLSRPNLIHVHTFFQT